jgi:hypothetical protein
VTKDDVLTAVSRLSSLGEITETELLHAYRSGAPSRSTAWLAATVAYLGAALVAAGIVVAFVAFGLEGSQALGLSAAVSIVSILGAALSKDPRHGPMSEALFLLGGLTFPLMLVYGAITLGYDASGPAVEAVIGLLGVAGFGALALVSNSGASLLLAAGFGAFALGMFGSWARILGIWDSWTGGAYGFFVAGVSLILLAVGILRTRRPSAFASLASLGCVLVLGSGLALGQWGKSPNMFWTVFYPFIGFGMAIWGANVKFPAATVLAILGLLAYLVSVTALLLPGMYSWPLLVAAFGGVLLIFGFLLSRRRSES